MTQDIRIPDIGDADDVEVVEILVKAGDQVGEDDPVIVIESDKASMEVPAGIAGVVDSVTVSVGDKVAEGQVIARLQDEAEGEQEQDAKPDQKDRDDEGERPAGRDGGEESRRGGRSHTEEGASRSGDRSQTEQEESEAGGASDEEKKESRPAGRSSTGQGAGSRTQEVRVPDIGDVEGVEVIEVAVKAGDQVDENDVLVVVESDKASMEIPSSHAGTVKEVHVSVGSQVEQDTLLVTLETREAAPAAEEQPPAKQQPPAKERAPARHEEAAGEDRDEARAKAPTARGDIPATAVPPTPPAEPAGSGTDVYAGPAVRRLARELGVDLKTVKGTGNRGRIVKDDVKSHVKQRMTSGAGGAPAAGGLPAMPEVDFSKFGEIEQQPLSRTRARGAENLHRAWLAIPHVTQHDEVDVTDLEEFRASLKSEGERRGVKVTPVAFIIKACCHALKEFPTFNASLDPSAKTFILKRYYHVGMAVDTPEGLVVPVIKHADRKGVWELSAEIAELAEKARNRKLAPGDMQGGSFSVSSLGAIGGTGFTPIINAPEVAILGVGRVTVRPVWRDDAFVPRKLLPLSLSYDHRAVNGAEAGRFVARLGELLSDIRRLAL